MNIKTLSFGCRLNALECDKISRMLAGTLDNVFLINTCSVTGEAERQCAQTVRKISRENPNAYIFVTGCGATRNPDLFARIPHTMVIDNAHKMEMSAYMDALKQSNINISCPKIDVFKDNESKLSKQFIQVQNGCNHDCTYCVTRLLRGKNVSFPYKEILADARRAIENGFYEIVLTGVDTASYVRMEDGKPVLLSDICARLLADVPEIKHLRLSSIDPASPEVPKIIDLMRHDTRFMPHLHLSMQSGSDTILKSMRRRHDSKKLLELIELANGFVSFSADIICGFPGETDELFAETCDIVRKMGLVHVHAFPYSPRPGTVAAEMPDQTPRNISKARVKIINEIANKNKKAFMEKQIGKTVSVLVEENNIGRTPDDIDIKILPHWGSVAKGDEEAKFRPNGEGDHEVVAGVVSNKTICNVRITGIENNMFVGICEQ